MKRNRHCYSNIIASFIGVYTCLFISACDTSEPTTTLTKPPEINKTAVPKPEPVLDLSLDNLSIEQKTDNDNALEEKNSALFDKLNQKKTESKISVSGKLLTDESKDKDYLKSVDGAQIIIKGNFD